MPGLEGLVCAPGLEVRIRLKRWNERMKFGTNSRIFCLFPHFYGSFYENLETFHHLLRISVKFWENFINFSRKNDQNSSTKIGMKWNFISFRQKSLTIFIWNFEVLAVRRQRNLQSCRARKMLKNASFLAIVAVDTAENEPLKVWGWFHFIFHSSPYKSSPRKAKASIAAPPRLWH